IRLTVPRAEIKRVMGPAMAELGRELAAQGIEPTGPMFSHHLRMDPNVWDFEVGLPIGSPLQETGRVKAGRFPGGCVARAVYRGPYEGLGNAWSDFGTWLASSGHQPTEELIERYLSGPESSPDPSTWRTELSRPLIR